MKYKNPVHRGFFPDPSVIRVGDDYYKVNSTFQYFPAIVISHSKDLVHWEIIGHAITENDYLDLSNILNSRGIWAPDISYYDGKFYIFATLRHNDENVPMRSQLVMTADRPEGPYCKPWIIPVDNIDPSHFVDDDGKHYMIIAPGITVVPLSDDCRHIAGEIKQVWQGTGERCPEGPHILKKDGWYYAIIAEGGTGYGHGINTGRSRSLYGPYVPSPYNPVLRQTDKAAQIQRSGHGKLVQTQSGDWYCMYLCGRTNGGNYTTIGRETALDPVQWTDDGWFVINGGKPSEEQEFPNLPVQEYKSDCLYDFSSGSLSLDWEWVRNPDYGSYEFTDKGLRLYTCDGSLSDISAKNILLMREKELSFSAEVKLEFTPAREGEQAGLTCYYSTSTYIRFSRCLGGLELVINRNMGEERRAFVPYDSNCVFMRVVTRSLSRSFEYSSDGSSWHLAWTEEKCVFLCDEGVPEDRKRHTGTLTGIYALNGGSGGVVPADFEYMKFDF